jgi:UDP-glucuronate 4-epimerase
MSVTLVTGAAGFIGYHVAQRLLERGERVVGVDNLNDYYDVALKEARLALLEEHENFSFSRLDISDRSAMADLFRDANPTQVVNLAAYAGVRHSLTHPEDYIDTNLVGFANILEGCRHAGVSHLVYASSSSVYGGNTKMPFAVSDRVERPLSLYAATKRANEQMAYVYAHLYGVHATGLRFFTVYGPWGRPDMALFLFTKAILNDEPIQVFNHGDMRRDFTYIDDIVEGLVRVLDAPPASAGESEPPHRVCNIGSHDPVELMDMIAALERHLGREARKEFLPMQPGDVPASFADVSGLEAVTGFRPRTPLDEGIERFVSWYRAFYDVS